MRVIRQMDRQTGMKAKKERDRETERVAPRERLKMTQCPSPLQAAFDLVYSNHELILFKLCKPGPVWTDPCIGKLCHYLRGHAPFLLGLWDSHREEDLHLLPTAPFLALLSPPDGPPFFSVLSCPSSSTSQNSLQIQLDHTGLVISLRGS